MLLATKMAQHGLPSPATAPATPIRIKNEHEATNDGATTDDGMTAHNACAGFEQWTRARQKDSAASMNMPLQQAMQWHSANEKKEFAQEMATWTKHEPAGHAGEAVGDRITGPEPSEWTKDQSQRPDEKPRAPQSKCMPFDVAVVHAHILELKNQSEWRAWWSAVHRSPLLDQHAF